MGLKRLVCSLAFLCGIGKVLSEEECPPLVEYIYSFGEYYFVFFQYLSCCVSFIHKNIYFKGDIVRNRTQIINLNY